MGFYINNNEYEATIRLDLPDRVVYFFMRHRMDFKTGLVGRVTKISYWAIAEHLEVQVTRGRGTQLVKLRDTPEKAKEEARNIVERLVSKGLLIKKPGAFLVFLCPLAETAENHKNQTYQLVTTPESTELTTPKEWKKPSNDAGFRTSSDYGCTTPENHCCPESLPHIKVHRTTTPPQSSSTDLTGVDTGDAGAGEGPNRDRASPSQAGQLTQPGNTHNDPYRDRPAGSHPAPGRRLDCGALPGDAPIQLRDGETGECSAESESTPDAVGAPDGARVEALTAVLVQRSIRVPADGVVVADWAARGVTPLELDQAVAKALAARAKEGSLQPIGVGYVSAVIQSERSAVKRAAEAARRAVEQGPRRAKDSDLEGLAKSVGMWPAPLGMSMPEFRHRVMNAVADQVGRRG